MFIDNELRLMADLSVFHRVGVALSIFNGPEGLVAGSALDEAGESVETD